ncbi:MAG: PilZ domain-containing protein [Terriglobales bacterium]
MTETTAQEQRILRRFAMELPVSVKYSNGGVHRVRCFTKNVSANGVFFLMDSQIGIGSEIEVVMVLPPEVTMTEPISVQCQARVVRVEPTSNSRVGIAATIHHYEFQSENQAFAHA